MASYLAAELKTVPLVFRSAFCPVCKRTRHLNTTQKAIVLITMWHTDRGGVGLVGERVPGDILMIRVMIIVRPIDTDCIGIMQMPQFAGRTGKVVPGVFRSCLVTTGAVDVDTNAGLPSPNRT